MEIKKNSISFIIIAFTMYCCISCCSLPNTTSLVRTENGKLKIIDVEKDKPYSVTQNLSRDLPQSFVVLSWNGLAGYRSVFKRITGLKCEAFECSEKKWDEIFQELSKEKDIILLQETLLDDNFLETIEGSGDQLSWNMVSDE
ncbi:hypothetical protein KJ966_28890 [bacterium]|nr:hypothetical protein [bacterium]